MKTFVLLHLDTEKAGSLRQKAHAASRGGKPALTAAEKRAVERILNLEMPIRGADDTLLQMAIFTSLFYGDYAVVATVDAENVAKVFPLTNNVHHSWVTNDGIVLTPAKNAEATINGDRIRLHMAEKLGKVDYPGGPVITLEDVDGVKPSLRSTSVGDLVFDSEARKLFFCNQVGWLELELSEIMAGVIRKVINDAFETE